MTEARDRRLQHFSSTIFSPCLSRSATPPPAFSPRPRTDYPEKREILTYKSTVFSPAEPITARFNPYKPQDHQNSDFYKVEPQMQSKLKSVTENKKQRNQPKTPQRSVTPQPNVTKSTPSPIGKPSKSQNTAVLTENKNVKHDKTTATDESTHRNTLKWSDSRSEIQRKTLRNQTPEERRLTESQSTVLGTAKQPKTDSVRSKALKENSEFDPFGREKTAGRGGVVRELTPTSANWKDARYEDKKRRWGENYSVAEFRDMQLRSSFDPPCSLPVTASRKELLPFNPQPPNPKEMKRLNLNQLDIPDIPKPEEVQLDTFLIKGLKPTDDAQTVKQLCQGLHIVSVETAVDDIAGNCTGQAKVVLRHLPGSDTVDRLKTNITDAGLEISPHQRDVRRKSHYTDLACTSFLDHQLQLEERRFPSDSPLPPKLTKMKLLGSTADLFGSTPGLGSTSQDPTRVSIQGQEQVETREQLQRWQTVKKTRSQTPTTVNVVRRNSSFLRPTESWKHKTKQ